MTEPYSKLELIQSPMAVRGSCFLQKPGTAEAESVGRGLKAVVDSGYQQVAHLAMAVTCEFRREERLWVTARSGLALVRKHWIDSKHDREQADLLDTSCLPSIALARYS